ncbi:MAG: type II toxin-antitoxin system RatA family toxin [Gammaproteobacteria bacterium]|nr:type II toxin-antitoxin system RatA family toxin [Gammaproteobacteria bacterium]
MGDGFGQIGQAGMRHVHRSALVPYPAARLFELVDAVEQYPEFVPGCRSVTVHERSDQVLIATLSLQRGGISASITTRNTREPPVRLTLELVSGPLESLVAEWRFSDLGEHGCKVELDARLAVRPGLVGSAVGLMVERLANRLVDVFCERARQRLG